MLKFRDNIFYVGVKDNTVNAYNNAYLIKSEKTALIDTVSERLSQTYIKKIEEILPVSEIDYLICNHSEPDKSGAVRSILELNPNIEVIGTIAAIKNLKEITNMTFNEHVAKDGTALDLGNGTELQFCIVPNLNWPDTMVTYEKESKTLFSCDMFSAYYDGDIFSESIVFNNRYKDALREYYDCNFTPFKGFVQRAIEKISSYDIQLICAGYGPAVGKFINEVIADYKKWNIPAGTNTKNVSIFYFSAYGNTAKMADVIEQTLIKSGLNVNVLSEVNMSTAEILNNSDALIIGTPTINKNSPQEIRNAIAQLRFMNVKGKPYFVFGSYGWSGEGVQLVNNFLKVLKMKPFEKPFEILFTPSDKDFDSLIEYTERFSDMLQNI